MNALEAINGFMGWMMCRDELVTIGSTQDAGVVAGLIKEWALENDLPDVTEDYLNNIKHPE